MNTTQIEGLRKLHNESYIPENQDYCLIDNHGRLVMGWITKERSEEYQKYYGNGKLYQVVTMEHFRQCNELNKQNAYIPK